jgi:hypothetical protein
LKLGTIIRSLSLPQNGESEEQEITQ